MAGKVRIGSLVCASGGVFARKGGSLLSALLLFSIGILLLLAPEPAKADVGAFEVREYMRGFDLPREEAKENLILQDRGVGIVGDLRETLGRDYAGVWFDNDRGEFVVPLVQDASSASVTRELTPIGLRGDFRIAPATSSWSELEGAQAGIDKALEPLFEDGLVQTSLDPRTNAVVIHQARDVSKTQRGQIQSLIAGENSNVEIRAEAVDRFEATTMGCNISSKVCDKPLRGGVFIEPSGVATEPTCTTGFKAIGDSDGKRYMLTAGHCYLGSVHWNSWDTSFVDRYVGPIVQAMHPGGDWAKIRVTDYGNWWEEGLSSWPSEVVYWGGNEHIPITTESWSYFGQAVCHSGWASGSSCGNVTALNKSVEQRDKYGNYQGTVHHLTEVSGSQFVALPGDSGGPIWAGNTALGLLSGGMEGASYLAYYVEITEATDALGAHVGTRIGSPPIPPTVQTNPATNVQEEQATLNGTVNPNGSETTYRFEYGKTTAYGKSIPIPNAGAGAGAQAVPVYLTPTLQPHTQYHFRLVATNPSGTSYGSDQVFTTGLRWRLRNSNSAGNPDAAFWFGLPGEKRVSGDWDGNGTVTPGTYNATTGVWKLRNTNTTGKADVEFQYGGGPWTRPVTGDWDANKSTTIGLYNPTTGVWRLKNTNSAGNADLEFQYGGSQYDPVTGDWDANGTTTIGVYEPSGGNWYLRNSNSGGPSEISFQYGGSQFIPVTGDWDANKTTTIGLFEPIAGNWALRNSNSSGSPNISFQHGGSQFTPLTGDWDANGIATPGLVEANAATVIEWRLRNTNAAGNPDVAFEFDLFGPKQVTGDWDGNGITTTGTYDPVTGVWKLRNLNSWGAPEIEFQFGGSPWTDPVTGDWDANGTTTIGLYNPTTGVWRLKNTNSAGNADLEFQYGGSQFKAVTGDWDGNKSTTIGLYDPTAGNWNLRNSNTAGPPQVSFQFGGSPWTDPVTGDWDANKSTTIGLYNPTTGVWRLKNTNSAGNADLEFQYGGDVWGPLSGDWNNDGKDTVGVGTR